MTLSSRRFGPIGPAALTLSLALPQAARAQLSGSEEKPAPNVLLMVDTSGSMEFMTDGDLPVCNPADPLAQNDKSRWIDLVEVMTGNFDSYSCWAQARNTSGFRNEFQHGTQPPYDFGYVNPYHRALSHSCLFGPGVMPDSTNPYAWPNGGVNTFQFESGSVVRPPDLASHTGCSAFEQSFDGLLDIYGDQVRFGLMTFDTRVNSGTGVSSGLRDEASGVAGTWSYYLSEAVTGHPANCSFDLVQEVGARNAAAPPWEGRMVAFGPPDSSDTSERNQRIQDVLLSTRPYGATPIAALLHDARDFLWNDQSQDPNDSARDFGPSTDPAWRATNCRKTIAVLLTDGEPNLDLRPYCEGAPEGGTAGRCPYERPEEIVSALRLDPPIASLSVETYVIGFALGSVTPAGEPSPISCSELTDAHCADPLNDGDTESAKRIQSCCTLNAIAAAGSLDDDDAPRSAYFAESREQLRGIFTQILEDVVQVSTRTLPVFSNSGDGGNAGFKFFSAFNPKPRPGEASLWEGVLERRRFVCDSSGEAKEEFDPLKGDDFAQNLNSGVGDARRFLSISSSTGVDLADTLRPAVVSTLDGLDDHDAVRVGPADASGFAALMSRTDMEVTAADCEGASTANHCRDLIVDHAVGLTNSAGLSRCPDSGTCNVLGGIFHSTPAVVSGRPSALLRDESYQAFVADMSEAARPSVLYTSSVDGFLHAFKLAPFPGSDGSEERLVDTLENNELWAFIPPAVVPRLKSQYPTTHTVLLDGAPVVRDVVAEPQDGSFLLHRRAETADGGGGTWRSILLQGFGDGQIGRGFFALDVTDPQIAQNGSGGPELLWQLTKSADGAELFGRDGKPLITTLYFGTPAREVAVAVLPGGRAAPDDSGVDTEIGTVMPTIPTGSETTRSVRSYSSGHAARSLTVVRLDSGEVVRTFRPTEGASLFGSSVVTETVIPSPIVGQPQAYPGGTGTIADRLFVGDQDGRLWRVDVASADPDDWTMKVFFDAFWKETGADAGEPVELPPVLSVDQEGNVTVAFATGDQQATSAPATLQNRVISVTEKLDETNGFGAHLNWAHQLEGGERVTGPMILFDSALYYSASRPPTTTTNSCDGGASRLFGAHYVLDDALEQGGDSDPLSGPAKAPGVDDLVIAQRDDGMIFGVSLEARPSCDSALADTPVDASFGYETVRQSASLTPGKVYLSYEVTGSSDDSRGVLEVERELTTPQIPATFESWALIYE